MDAVRCLRCGETRWSFRPETLARRLAEPCEACGGQVALERRHPGAEHSMLIAERRDNDLHRDGGGRRADVEYAGRF